MAQRALKAGAQAYLLKVSCAASCSARSVWCTVARSGFKLNASSIANSRQRGILTDREIEVLRLIANGRSNKLIAYDLSINEETAKTHVKNILAKLHANDRTHALRWPCGANHPL